GTDPVLWDVQKGTPIRTETGMSASGDACVTFSADGKFAAKASARTITAWDGATGRELWSLQGDKGWISSLAFSPDGKLLLSGGLEGAKLRETATGKYVCA